MNLPAGDPSDCSAMGRLTIEANRKGLSIATADGLIAATALEHDLVLVTRDIGDFAGVTIPILNPWDT